MNGTSGNDAITATGGATPTVQVGGLQALSLVTADTESLLISAGDGADALTVNSSADPFLIPLVYDGGTGSDSLILSGGSASSDIYSVGPQPGAGTSNITFTSGIGGPQLVNFLNIEPVIDLVASPLAVNATNADNAINYNKGPNSNTSLVGGAGINSGQVSVDGFEPVEFANKTALTINGQSGSDTINLNNSNQPTGLGSIVINGNDPTASDRLIVNGNVAADLTIDTSTRNITNAEPSSTITYNTIESITVVKGISTALAVQGATDYTVTPGAATDQGTILADTFPIAYQGFGVGTNLKLNGTGTLTINGTAANDAFSVAAADGSVSFTGRATVQRTGTSTSLTLNGLDGDDTFIVNGTTPYTAINLNGGDPSGSDNVTLNGTAGGDTIGLTLAATGDTVSGVIGGPVTLVDVENLTINSLGGADTLGVTNLGGVTDLKTAIFNSGGDATDTFTATGTTGPDDMTVTPISNASATITANGVGPVVTANLGVAGTSTFNVDAAGGSDQLTVNGTQSGETITINGTSVTVGGLKIVNYTNTEHLQVDGLAGNDTFNVTPAANTTIFVDGGDPIGVLPGDQINISGGGPVTFFAGPQKDEGGFQVGSNATVSFAHIETIGSIVGPGPVLIVGTNGDDDITVIARDSSYNIGCDGVQDFTVSVNQGPDILFINASALSGWTFRRRRF